MAHMLDIAYCSLFSSGLQVKKYIEEGNMREMSNVTLSRVENESMVGQVRQFPTCPNMRDNS